MAVATISVNFASLAEVRTGQTGIKSVNPLQLFNALNSGAGFYDIAVRGAIFNNNVTIATGNLNVSDSSKTISFAGDTTISKATVSNSSITGALVVTGGVGIGGRLNVQGQTIISTGGLKVDAGGLTVGAGPNNITGGLTVATGGVTLQGGGQLVVQNNGGAQIQGRVTIQNGGTGAQGLVVDTGGLSVLAGTTTSITSTSIALIGAVQVTGSIAATGDITAFSASDRNLKDNIINITDALAKVEKLNGVEFDWNSKSDKTGHDVGLIAQDVEQVLPEIVVTRDDGYKALRYEKVVVLLVEAIKELKEKINILESTKGT